MNVIEFMFFFANFTFFLYQWKYILLWCNHFKPILGLSVNLKFFFANISFLTKSIRTKKQEGFSKSQKLFKKVLNCWVWSFSEGCMVWQVLLLFWKVFFVEIWSVQTLFYHIMKTFSISVFTVGEWRWILKVIFYILLVFW